MDHAQLPRVRAVETRVGTAITGVPIADGNVVPRVPIAEAVSQPRWVVDVANVCVWVDLLHELDFRGEPFEGRVWVGAVHRVAAIFADQCRPPRHLASVWTAISAVPTALQRVLAQDEVAKAVAGKVCVAKVRPAGVEQRVWVQAPSFSFSFVPE